MSIVGTRIPTDLENPYDNIMYFLGSYALLTLKRLGMTPNTLTIIGAIFVVGSLTSMYYGYFLLAAMMYAVAYWFDCIDGQFARHFKMTSPFGEKLDHSVDLLFRNAGLSLVILLIRIPLTYKVVFFLIYFTLSVLVIYNMNCQQNYYYHISNSADKDDMNTKMFASACKRDSARKLSIARYFGPGSKTVFIIAFMCFLAWWSFSKYGVKNIKPRK